MYDRINSLKLHFEAQNVDLTHRSLRVSNIRGMSFLVILICLALSYQAMEQILYKIVLGLSIIVFITLVIYHIKLEESRKKSQSILEILAEYEARLGGDWKSFSADGMGLLENVPDFMLDLHIIGENSLFKFLNVAKSIGGKKRLASILCIKDTEACELFENQTAIVELREKFEFVIDLQERLKQIINIENTEFKSYFHLFETKVKCNKFDLIMSIFLSALTILSLVLGILKLVDFSYFSKLFVIQLLSSYIYHRRYRAEFAKLSRCIQVLGRLEGVYHYVIGIEFSALKNIRLRQMILDGKQLLSKISVIDSWDSLRKNVFSYMFGNIFFSLNRIIIYKYSKLLEHDSSKFKQSVEGLEEFEMLISLATMCFVRENICIPQVEKAMHLECQNMIYPLIDENSCVSNDFETEDFLNIITGSNMSGKTSFMRAVGVNLVLAYAGTYVNASSFSVPIMQIFTSINVKDDINNGISTFYGELLRIKSVLDFARENAEPFVVFIDEIFKGTNYHDRIYGAKKVLEQLSTLNCIVFLTTHDFELCEIPDNKLINYHFCEDYEAGKMIFRHKIKAGKSSTTNAQVLMHEVGII